MPDAFENNCPLCLATAVFEHADRCNAQYFYCEFCKDILLVGRAMREPIAEIDRQSWSKLSASLNDDEFIRIYYEQGQHQITVEAEINLHKFGV